MLFVMILLLVAKSISCEEEHIELEPFPDYYAMLNVSHDAEMKEIKRSFRKLAMAFHPDKNKSEDAQMIFQELSEAYSVLSNVDKKAEYDELFKHFYDLSEDDVHEYPAENPDQDDSSRQASDETVKTESAFESENTDKKTEEASSLKKDDASSTDKDEDSSTDKDEDSEMDDETLFKVLKFLAENDYIITKRTKRTPSNPDQSFYNREGESRSKRSADSTNSRTYSEYRTSSHNASGDRGQTNGHHGHDHAWTHSHQHKPRAEHENARYGNQFHGSEQVYCRSTVRWENNVKITSKTCL